MKRTFRVLLMLIFVIPITVQANYTYTCEQLEGALNYDHDNENGTFSYKTTSGYYSGGPLYSLSYNEQNLVTPVYDAFSVSQKEKNSMMILDHWCIHDGEYQINWDQGLDCGCDTIPIYWNIMKNDTSEDLKVFGVISEAELSQLRSYRYLSDDFTVSNSAYGMSCHINDAAMHFRFNYSGKNPEAPLPPRAYIQQNQIRTCTVDVLVYKLWTICESSGKSDTYFEDYENPITVKPNHPYRITHDDTSGCTVFAETNDPFRPVIRSYNVSDNYETPENGSEHPELKVSGADVIIEPSSDGWWSSSAVYRAKIVENGNYEVTTLLRPNIDECVPPGYYVYFVTSHSCINNEVRCLNYSEISVNKTIENSLCPAPDNTVKVLKHELDSILTDIPKLSQDNPPSYNTYRNSCAILPGEITKRLMFPKDIIPARVVHNIENNNLILSNCGEEELEVEKVEMECSDNRNDKTFSNVYDGTWKISSGDETAISLIDQGKESCFYNCLLSIYSSDDQRNIAFENYNNGNEPFNENTAISLETDGAENTIYAQETAVVEINIENRSCMDMKNPSITVPEYISGWSDELPTLIFELSDPAKITDQSGDLKISTDTQTNKISLAGTLPISGKVKVKLKIKVSSEYEYDEYFCGNGYKVHFQINHDDLKTPAVVIKEVAFECRGSEKNEQNNDDEDYTESYKSENSSGCTLSP